MDDDWGDKEGLHLYAQSQWHDDAYIVGPLDALVRLRDALTRAIERKDAAATLMFTNDGEGYTTFIVPVDAATFNQLALPYTRPDCGFERQEATWPGALDLSAATDDLRL